MFAVGFALVVGSGAVCESCTHVVSVCVHDSGTDLVDHNSWKHGHEAAGDTKVLSLSSGFKDRCSFVDTVLGRAALEQYLRGAWAVRCTYRTAWAVQSCCRCSYSCGSGPAVGPQVSGNWEFLRGLWRAVAPLMAPWCADEEMPTCANLNFYGGSGSHVRWHSDNEGLFGKQGESTFVVSMSLGVSALFKWKPGPSLDSGASSSWLHHGDLLVMDGCCQDEYLHCTDPLQGEERVNITFRWIRNHVPRCPLAIGVVCCLPTCAKGSLVFSNTELFLPGLLSVVLLVLLGWGFLSDCPLLILAGIALPGLALQLAFLSGAVRVR